MELEYEHDIPVKWHECAWPGCSAAARFRAPRTPGSVQAGRHDYIHFCLHHVRLYNQSWNYYAAMSPAAIAADHAADRVWRRPSWPGRPSWQAGKHDCSANLRKEAINLAEGWDQGKAGADSQHFRHKGDNRDGKADQWWPVERKQVRALHQLGLDAPTNIGQIKARYKVLVKRLHPDHNRTTPQELKVLQDINEAYSCLRKAWRVHCKPCDQSPGPKHEE
ncbi:MAG: J domain-containing protein [Pseudomonadota bacterium]